jgi:hypothetical protein
VRASAAKPPIKPVPPVTRIFLPFIFYPYFISFRQAVAQLAYDFDAASLPSAFRARFEKCQNPYQYTENFLFYKGNQEGV